MSPEAADREAWRRLLRRVRDAMAEPGDARERLDRVVRIIATEMVAEVCSIYFRLRGGSLLLVATEGLKPEAVLQTRLRAGEGLVGEIAATARALALPEAQSHPKFAYRPETGEEVYHSFMGVPIVRAGRVVGVLVVQNRTARLYTEEEIEALETVAMVIAELAVSDEVSTALGLRSVADDDGTGPMRLGGLRLNDGLAIGSVVVHERSIAIQQLVADDTESELERLAGALRRMHRALDDLFAADDLEGDGEHREVFDAYRMFARDRGWLERIRSAIGQGLSAEAAVQRVQNEMRTRFRQIRDPYIRERVVDIDDLANRLLQHLAGRDEPEQAVRDLPEDAVLAARTLGPAELLEYDREHLRALLMEEGSATAHVAIVARALDIPVLGRVANLLDVVQPGDRVIVDADHGQLLVRPAPRVEETFVASMRARAERRALYAALKDEPAVTVDGVPISLQVNAGLLIDMQAMHDCGAEGVGLYRTEVPFMVRHQFPDVEEQTDLYRRVLELADDKPVVFRTLDIGGDKVLPYLPSQREANPALGWRAVRLALDEPAILRDQLRALVRAAGGRRLDVMFPMITEVAEFDAARGVLQRELVRAEESGEPVPTAIRAGAMVEVPALLWQLPALLARVDFLSIGSNDLLQFVFAADRDNARVGDRYDVLSPSALNLFRTIFEHCEQARVPVTFCGEVASGPLEAMALIGVGCRSISAQPHAIGPIKVMAGSLELAPLAEYMRSLLDLPDHSLRPYLRDYATRSRVIV